MRKIRNLTSLDLNNIQLAILDRALNVAEDILLKFPIGRNELAVKSLPNFVSSAFAEHVRIHLAIELRNISNHGHRNDDPEDQPKPSTYTQLVQLTELIAAGNTEFKTLEQSAKRILEEIR